MKRKVLVAMSGGVDSSVSAYLLKREGFAVTGVTMCLGVKEAGRSKPACCGREAVRDAKRVCHKLRIPHYVMDFSKYLEKGVIDNFVSEYIKGRTPNPCVDCNRNLKFGILLRKARALGFDFLATGHYASIEKKGKNFYLKKAKDKAKDQSYFLYAIKKNTLRFILFPLGGLTKEGVRGIARRARLPVAEKAESQDIFFIRDRNYHGFLSERIKTRVTQGPIIDLHGAVLGNHKGAFFYTVGQRGGLGGGHKNPLYVLSVDTRENRLIVGEKKDLRLRRLMAGEVNLLAGRLPKKAFAKIRYNHKEAECKIKPLDNKTRLEVVFKAPQEAITPGQSVVLYSGDKVLAGGVIEKAL